MAGPRSVQIGTELDAEGRPAAGARALPDGEIAAATPAARNLVATPVELGVTGDYLYRLYRDFASFQFDGGMWSIFRVLP